MTEGEYKFALEWVNTRHVPDRWRFTEAGQNEHYLRCLHLAGLTLLRCDGPPQPHILVAPRPWGQFWIVPADYMQGAIDMGQHLRLYYDT